MARARDDEKDVPAGERSYRLPPRGVASLFIMGYALLADVINAVPFLGLVTNPLLYVSFMMFGVFPFWMRKDRSLLASYKKQLPPQAYQKLEAKIQGLESGDAPVEGFFHSLMNGVGGFMFLWIVDSLPVISWYWWATDKARALIKKSRAIDLYKSRVRYFAEKYGAEETLFAKTEEALALAQEAALQKKTEEELLEQNAALNTFLSADQSARHMAGAQALAQSESDNEALRNAMTTGDGRKILRARPDTELSEIDENQISSLREQIYSRRWSMRDISGAFPRAGVNTPGQGYRAEEYTEALQAARAATENEKLINTAGGAPATDGAATGNAGNADAGRAFQTPHSPGIAASLREAKRLNTLSANDYAQIVAGSGLTENPEAKSGFLRQLREDVRTEALSREEFNTMVNAYPLFTPEDKQLLSHETDTRLSAAHIARAYPKDTGQLREAITKAMQQAAHRKAAQSMQMSQDAVNTAVDLALKRIREAPLVWEPINDRAINDAVEEVLAILKREHTGEHLEIHSEPNTNPLSAS